MKRDDFRWMSPDDAMTSMLMREWLRPRKQSGRSFAPGFDSARIA